MSNELQTKQENTAVAKAPSFSAWMNRIGSKIVSNTLQDPKRQMNFIANVVSAVSTNTALQECDQASVVSAALQCEVLGFPLNSSLGYAYLVPYKITEWDKEQKKRVEVGKAAQFQMGYKGYIQLAIRSGQYKEISVAEVREGELGYNDPLKGMSFNWLPYAERKNKKVIGYAGYFELTSGFTKTVYFEYEEMLDHADMYSAAFSKEKYLKLKKGEIKEDWSTSSYWYKNFDDMAKKTVLRQMLSKWGIMSVEMQNAFEKDQTISTDGKKYDYIDNPQSAAEKVAEEQQTATASKKVDAQAYDVNEETGEIDFDALIPDQEK